MRSSNEVSSKFVRSWLELRSKLGRSWLEVRSNLGQSWFEVRSKLGQSSYEVGSKFVRSRAEVRSKLRRSSFKVNTITKRVKCMWYWSCFSLSGQLAIYRELWLNSASTNGRGLLLMLNGHTRSSFTLLGDAALPGAKFFGLTLWFTHS